MAVLLTGILSSLIYVNQLNATPIVCTGNNQNAMINNSRQWFCQNLKNDILNAKSNENQQLVIEKESLAKYFQCPSSKYPNFATYIQFMLDIAKKNKLTAKQVKEDIKAYVNNKSWDELKIIGTEEKSFHDALEKKMIELMSSDEWDEDELQSGLNSFYKSALPEILELFTLDKNTHFKIVKDAMADVLYDENGLKGK